MKPEELAEIDLAVARIEGLDAFVSSNHFCWLGAIESARLGHSDMVKYSPTTDWHQGGPIIEKYKIAVSSSPRKTGWHATIDNRTHYYGDTPLIAAMKALVEGKG